MAIVVCLKPNVKLAILKIKTMNDSINFLLERILTSSLYLLINLLRLFTTKQGRANLEIKLKSISVNHENKLFMEANSYDHKPYAAILASQNI